MLWRLCLAGSLAVAFSEPTAMSKAVYTSPTCRYNTSVFTEINLCITDQAYCFFYDPTVLFYRRKKAESSHYSSWKGSPDCSRMARLHSMAFQKENWRGISRLTLELTQTDASLWNKNVVPYPRFGIRKKCGIMINWVFFLFETINNQQGGFCAYMCHDLLVMISSCRV